MRFPLLSRLAAASLALVIVTAACNDSTAPQFSDPAALSADLQKVNETFDSPVFQGFSGMSEFMAPPGAAPVGPLLAATSPELLVDPTQPNQRSAAAAEGLRSLVATLSGPQRGPIIPDALYGKAYEWDPAAGSYVESTTRTGPADGVRFYLYAMDPLTHLPAEPLNELGYVDLMDKSAGQTLALQVVVKNSAGTATYVDYTVSITSGTASFQARAVGYISNGLTGNALRRLDFDVAFAASETATAADVSADATFNLANSSVRLEIHDAAHFEGNTWTFTRDFRFHRPGEVVTVTGNVTITQTAPDTFTVSGQVTVKINGRVFVTITFQNGQVHTSRELTEQEQAVIIRLLEAIDDVWDAIEDFFDPAAHFWG